MSKRMIQRAYIAAAPIILYAVCCAGKVLYDALREQGLRTFEPKHTLVVFLLGIIFMILVLLLLYCVKLLNEPKTLFVISVFWSAAMAVTVLPMTGAISILWYTGWYGKMTYFFIKYCEFSSLVYLFLLFQIYICLAVCAFRQIKRVAAASPWGGKDD